MSYRAVILDVDGTLVDSNDAHARAWVDGLAEHGRRRAVRTCPAADRHGQRQTAARSRRHRRGFEKASALATRARRDLRARLPAAAAAHTRCPCAARAAPRRAAASWSSRRSAEAAELRGLLRVADVEKLIDSAAHSDDADALEARSRHRARCLAKRRCRAAEVIMLGDTPYDVEAARRAGIASIAFRCGGWSDGDLRAPWRSMTIRRTCSIISPCRPSNGPRRCARRSAPPSTDPHPSPGAAAPRDRRPRRSAPASSRS